MKSVFETLQQRDQRATDMNNNNTPVVYVIICYRVQLLRPYITLTANKQHTFVPRLSYGTVIVLRARKHVTGTRARTTIT